MWSFRAVVLPAWVVAEAARETNNYNIGVDYDFALAM